jgi:hypothetical protein
MRLPRPISACLVVVGMLAISTQGCSSLKHGGSGELPPRPALGSPIDRIGRPLTGNALIGPLAPDEESDRRKEQYNRAAPADWPQFSADIEQTLGLYDGLDGTCGNQWLARHDAGPQARYRVLAKLLADDRLWVDTESTVCSRYLAVELADLATPGSASGDCGGRTPSYDASNVFRSLLVLGKTTGVDDGLGKDDRVHSVSDFPFLAHP